jgi:hypothetical protein
VRRFLHFYSTLLLFSSSSPTDAVYGYSLNSTDPIKTSDFLSTPLWKLALTHRRLLNASRTLPGMADFLDWIDENTSASFPAVPIADCSWAQPWRKERSGNWVYTSQLLAGSSFPLRSSLRFFDRLTSYLL